jgi:hypothetical protein
MIGHIINFDYTYNPSDLCFNCTTEIASNSKFYFGLSFDGAVGKLNENETQTKKTLKELFGEDIKQNIQSASKTLNGLILNKTQTKGRIFSPKEFRTHRKVTQGQIQDANVVYITFGLLVDIINDVIRVEHAEGRSEQFSIQVDGVKIGAHPNIISCNKKFLIPNAMAPYFSPESLSDSPERTTQPKNKLTESPLFESSKLNKTDSADKLMDMVLNNKKRRQNLSEALNYLNEDGWWNHSFPSLESVPNSLYYGYLSDIFLDYSSIEEKIIRSKSIKDFFTTLCQELNSEIRIWNIEFVSGTKQNTWTFRDSKFLDIDRLKAIKKEFGIIHDGDLIYNLDVFTQESVIKELSFGVKLSDSVANMVLHQANSQLATDGGNVTTTNQKFFINPVSDYLLEKLATNKTGGNSTSLTGKELNPSNYNQLPQSQKDAVDAKRENYLKALSEKATKERSFMKNIDDNVILFEEQINGQPRKTLRLNLPPDQKSKLLHMLEDEEQPLFTNLNSMPIPGVKVEFTLLGVAGFRTFQVFKVSNLPKPYDKGALFQITEIKHSITTDGWNTRIVANVRPIKSIETLIK